MQKHLKILTLIYCCVSPSLYIIIIIGIQPLGRFGQGPELSQSTGIAQVGCILGKFVGVVCHCFPPVYIYIYIYIQGVSRLQGITAGGDFLGLCDEKSSHKRVSNFGWLQSCGRFLIPVHTNRVYRTSWLVMHSPSLVANFSQLQTVQFPLSRHLGGMRG